MAALYNSYYSEVMEEFDARRNAELERVTSLTAYLRGVSPEFAEADRRLESVGVRLLSASCAAGDKKARIAAIRAETEELRSRRSELLVALGYSADAVDPHFACGLCSDTGYTEHGICSCLRAALAKASLRSSGLGTLCDTMSFSNFSLDYYRDSEESYRNMALVLERAQSYASRFSGTGSGNLLLCGNTGLGKTHICCAIAKEVAEKGYRIIYVGAQRMFDDFSEERFRNGASGLGDRYIKAELLILDDLGTEVSNQFTVACLYDVINARIVSGLPTIVNTNLTASELRDRYTDRIASRLFGEYSILPFTGKDIRMQKITNG